jgi:hypothetical protein
MKRFVMTVTEEGGNIHIDGENSGFSGIELVGIFEAKKQDILDQMNHPEKYKHVRKVNVDGEQIAIEEVESDDQN